MYVLSDKKVKIRKPHKCWGCKRQYNKGDQLQKIDTVDQGLFLSSYWCDVCDALFNQVAHDWDDGYGYGELRDRWPDEWAEMQYKMEKDKNDE